MPRLKTRAPYAVADKIKRGKGGKFQKGTVGGPGPNGGRLDVDLLTVREMAIPYTEEMVLILVQIARFSRSDIARIMAADKVITRARGKEASFQEMQQIDKRSTNRTWIDIANQATSGAKALLEEGPTPTIVEEIPPDAKPSN